MKSIGMVIYLVIGVLVAMQKDYLGNLDSIGDVVNLLLAIVLWPLVLLGVKFNINIGGGRDNDRNGALLWFGPALTHARTLAASARRKMGLSARNAS